MGNSAQAQLTGQVLSAFSTPVGTSQIFNGIKTGNGVDTSLAALQSSVGFLQLIGTKISNPLLIGVPFTALAADVNKMVNSYGDNGTIDTSVLYDAAANLSAIAGTLALIGAETTLALPVGVGVAVVATGVGIGLTAATLASQGQTIDVNGLINDLKPNVQSAVAVSGGDISAFASDTNAITNAAGDVIGYVTSIIDSTNGTSIATTLNADGSIDSQSFTSNDGSGSTIVYNTDQTITQTNFSPNGPTISTTYDGNMNAISSTVTNQDNSSTTERYDSSGNVVFMSTTDAYGGVSSVSNTYTNGVLTAQVDTNANSMSTTTYNNDGSVSYNSTVNADGSSSSVLYYDNGNVEHQLI